MQNTLHLHIWSMGASLNTPLPLDILKDARAVMAHSTQVARLRNKCDYTGAVVTYQKMSDLLNKLPKTGKVICLASGDALFYGVGDFLKKNLPNACLFFYPNTNSLQAAVAKVGRAYQDIKTLSLHGRALYTLRAHLKKDTTLFVLTCPNNTPNRIACELKQVGFEKSRVWLFCALGEKNETVQEYKVNDLARLSPEYFQQPNVLLVDIKGESFLPTHTGILDEHWLTLPGKKRFTKQLTRLYILAQLQCTSNSVAWDLGCGFGALSLEWARCCPKTSIHAVERCLKTCQVFLDNCKKFGHHGNLHLHKGDIEDVMDQLPAPSYVVVGGNANNKRLECIAQAAFSRLLGGGKMVLIAATEDTKYTVFQMRKNLKPLKRISSQIIHGSHQVYLGEKLAYKPDMPICVTLFEKTK